MNYEETDRLRTLRSLGILDTASEPLFEDAVRLATAVTGAPMALVSLVDDCRQWFKARIGIDLPETPLDQSFCAITICQNVPLIVEDASKHPHFHQNPLVTGPLHLRFYAGVQIFANGLPMGTLCVLDTEPRTISPAQVEALQVVARFVTHLLEGRHALSTYVYAARRFESLFYNLPVACCTFDGDGAFREWNRLAESTFDIPAFTASEMNLVDLMSIKQPGPIGCTESKPPAPTPASGEQMRSVLDRVLSGESIEGFEWTHLRSDGTVRSMESNFYPLENASKQIIGGVSSHMDVTDRNMVRDRLRLLSIVAAEARNGVIITDAEERTLYVNAAFTRISGYDLSDMAGARPGDLLNGPETDADDRRALRDAIRARRPVTVETINYHKYGTPYWINVSLSPVFDDRGEVTHFVAIEDDVSKRKESERKLAESAALVSANEARFRTAINAMQDGLVVQDLEGHITMANASAAKILELTGYQLHGRTSMDPRWRAIRDDGTPFPGDEHPGMVALRTGKPQYEVSMGLNFENSETKWASINAVPLLDDEGRPYSVVVSFADVTLRRRQEKIIEKQMETIRESSTALEERSQALEVANRQLEELASTDPLTGLQNRRSFQDFLSRELRAMARARAKQPVSLLLLDVDKFKLFNDTYGHQAGDEVLQSVGAILAEGSREHDLVARYGGEEFVLVLPGADADEALAVGERIRSALENATWPFRPITASFGVSTTHSANTTSQQIIEQADRAMYRSKESGRNQVTHFDLMDAAA